jgi:hypothetical protein
MFKRVLLMCCCCVCVVFCGADAMCCGAVPLLRACVVLVCLLFPNSSNRSEPTVTLSIDGLQWNDTKTLPRVVEDFEMLHSITPPRSESDWTTDSLATAESVQFVRGLLALHGLGSAKDA